MSESPLTDSMYFLFATSQKCDENTRNKKSEREIITGNVKVSSEDREGLAYGVVRQRGGVDIIP